MKLKTVVLHINDFRSFILQYSSTRVSCIATVYGLQKVIETLKIISRLNSFARKQAMKYLIYFNTSNDKLNYSEFSATHASYTGLVIIKRISLLSSQPQGKHHCNIPPTCELNLVWLNYTLLQSWTLRLLTLSKNKTQCLVLTHGSAAAKNITMYGYYKI